MTIPPQRNNIPEGRVGLISISTLVEELEGVDVIQQKNEKIIIFHVVILKQTSEVRQVWDIWQRAKMWIVDWRAGNYRIMVKYTARTSIALVSKVSRGILEEAISKIFTSLILQGKIRTVL